MKLIDRIQFRKGEHLDKLTSISVDLRFFVTNKCVINCNVANYFPWSLYNLQNNRGRTIKAVWTFFFSVLLLKSHVKLFCNLSYDYPGMNNINDSIFIWGNPR